MTSELPTWWPLDVPMVSDLDTADLNFACVIFDFEDGRNCYLVFDEGLGMSGHRTTCDTLLEVFAVLIEIAKRKAPHTLPPSYLSE